MRTAADLLQKYKIVRESLEQQTAAASGQTHTALAQKPIAYYCDAVAGAGKTFNSVNLAALLASSGEHVIFCQPSLDLVNETAKSFKRHPRIFAKHITSQTTTTVGKHIADFVASPDDDSVLLCTHAGLFNTRYWVGADKWVLFFDEAFEPIADLSVNIANSEDRLSMFNNLFQVTACEYPDQYRLVVKNPKFV